jgi:hypothetical protein
MSAIYSAYSAANYSATIFAKSTSGSSSNQVAGSVDQSEYTTSVSFNGDVVTISQEGLKASEMILSAEERKLVNLQLPDEKDLSSPISNLPNSAKETKKYWYDYIERTRKGLMYGNYKDASGAWSVPSWLTSNFSTKLSLQEINKTKFTPVSASTLWKPLSEKIDGRITKILEENNITLTKNETLKFSINQDGKITVGDKIGANKKELLEKIFNEDSELRSDLLQSHLSFLDADQHLLRSDSASSSTDSPLALKFASLNVFLLRDYGIAVNDLEITSDEERLSGSLPLKFKEGSNDELLMKLFTEDADLFSAIAYELQQTDETPEFEYNFSYKNGVTLDSSQGEQQESLDKRYKYVVSGGPAGPGGNEVSFSLLVNSSGEIVDGKMTEFILKDHWTSRGEDNKAGLSLTIDSQGNLAKARITDSEKYENIDQELARTTRKMFDYNAASTKSTFETFMAKLKTEQQQPNIDDYQPDTINAIYSQNFNTALQQYVWETQRLLRFDTGISKEEAENTGVVINRSWSYENMKNYSPRGYNF